MSPGRGPRVRNSDIAVRVRHRGWSLALVGCLAAGLAGAGCGGGTLGGADAGGGIGGLGGWGGEGAVGFGGLGGIPMGGGPGGDGGGSSSCIRENARAIIGCGDLAAVSLTLSPGGEAFVSFREAASNASVSSWDNSGAWQVIIPGFQASVAPQVRGDSLGGMVMAYVLQTDTVAGDLLIYRWDGSTWEYLGADLPSTGADGLAGVELEIDALDRPVLLLSSPSPPWGNKLTVHRREAGSWVQLGGATQINSAPATSGTARLALDSFDGITPSVAYQPEGTTQPTIVVLRYTASGWVQPPSLTRGQSGDFDLAVAGGQAFLAYIDGVTADKLRAYVSQGGESGWSAGVQVNRDTDWPVQETRILATGPAQENLLVAYQEFNAVFGKYQVSFKQGPDWSRVPGDVPPIAGADMQGFEMAIDPSRIAVVWSNAEQSVLAYHEFPR